jgi:segregation and condensation protein B
MGKRKNTGDEGRGDAPHGERSPLDDVPTRPINFESFQPEEEEKTNPGARIGELADESDTEAIGGVDRIQTDPGGFPASDSGDDEVTTGDGFVPPGELPSDDQAPDTAPIDIGSDPDKTPPEGARILDFAQARAEEAESAGEEGGGEDEPGQVPFEQLEPLIEALLFASDKPLGLADLKRLTGERDGRLINQALESLVAKRRDAGVQVMSLGGAYSFRTNPVFGEWVSRLVAGKPVRLSRAMLETLAIVAYRQPITRPEIDDIRGVDCGPVLKTLLDRNLVRIIGKKEEVGRPMLYGTTPEFLRIFSLKDLTQLPTLRQFHELSAEHQAKVDESHPVTAPAAVGAIGAPPLEALSPPALSPEPGEDDRLISELEEASEAATRAAGPLSPEPPPEKAP